MRVSGIFRAYRAPFAFALGLVLIENVAWIVEPSLFGPVLDALIANAGMAPGRDALRKLSVWVAVFAVNSGVGALRRAVDPRIYLRVYADIAAGIVAMAGPGTNRRVRPRRGPRSRANSSRSSNIESPKLWSRLSPSVGS